MNRLYLILITALAAAAAPQANAYDASHYAGNSRLAQGHWVKIKVDGEGIYQLSYAQLRTWGFDDPAKVNVYGYSAVEDDSHEFDAAMVDDICRQPSMHIDGERILFYGLGDRRASVDNMAVWSSGTSLTAAPKREINLYDTGAYYFISDVDGVVDLPVTAYADPAALTPLTSHIHVDLYEEDNILPVGYGVGFHNRQLDPALAVEFNFSIKNYKASHVDANILLYTMMASGSPTSGYTMSVDKGSLPTGTKSVYEVSNSFTNCNDYEKFQESGGRIWLTPTSAAAGVEDQDVTFRANMSSSNPVYFADDYAIFAYPRSNRLDAEDPCLVMNLSTLSNSAGQSIVFPEAAASTNLWLVDRSYNVEPLEGRYEAGNMSFTLPRTATRAIAFDASYASYPTPTLVGEVDNQDLHSQPTPEMLIICTKEYLDAANELARIHRTYQGISTLVVPQDMVYNEFSSGTRSVMAYRRLAKMLNDRNPSVLRGILFYGPGCSDNRNILTDPADRLVTYQTTDPAQYNNIVSSYAGDAIFGMLQDTYRHVDIEKTPVDVPVGRVPVLNEGEAAIYNAKVADRLQAVMPPATYNHVLFLSGHANDNAHLQQSLEIRNLMLSNNPNIQSDILPTNLYMTSDDDCTLLHNLVLAALQSGVCYATYSGHGSSTNIGANGYIDNYTVSQDRYDFMPFFTFSSCSQFEFDRLSRSLLDKMMFQEGGGAIAGLGASRSVYLSQNLTTAKSMAYAFATAQPGDTFGDMYAAARRWVIASNPTSYDNNSYLINNMAYNLGGDPLIPIDVPAYRCSLETIGGGDESTVIKPLVPTVITGRILDTEGVFNPDFNGEIVVKVFDGEHDMSSNKLSGDTEAFTPMVVTVENEILSMDWGTVTNGIFTATVLLPERFYESDDHLMVLAATDPSTGQTAITNVRVHVSSTAPGEDLSDITPAILEMYATIDGTSATEEVPADFEIYALVDPSSVGLNFSQTGIKPLSRMVVDGLSPINRIDGGMQRRADGRFDFRWTMQDLSEGRHTIELIIVNNAGQTDRRMIDVNVVSRQVSGTVVIAEAVASSTATIDLTGNVTDTCRLLISDLQGNTVYTAKNVTFPYKWHLRDNDGNEVPDGLYKVSVLLQDGRYYGHTAKSNVIVIR